jgi:hypothetical protein
LSPIACEIIPHRHGDCQSRAAFVISSVPLTKGDLMADTKDKVKEKIDAAAEKAKQATDKVSDAAKGAAQKVGQKVEDVGQKIKDSGK